MKIAPETTVLRDNVDGSLKSLRRDGFHSLSFHGTLEDKFESDTRLERSHRLWFEGLIAIVVFNACMVLDYVFIKDGAWLSVLGNTAHITPLALGINMMMRLNPPRWLREGSVAASMVYICLINLGAQGQATSANALFGTICVLITALFAGVVMRLRFGYSLTAIAVMVGAGFGFLIHTPSLHVAEMLVGCSLLLLGAAIILTATYSLEREERLSYLLCLQGEMKSEELAMMNLELQQITNIDKLTGLPNRRALEDRMVASWLECKASGLPLAAVVIDIDHFKVINDVYGHLYGDEALRRIASLLPQALRGKEDIAARFGGEEFVILLPQADQEIALGVAERVRKLVETAGTPIANNSSTETMMWATVSCGVSVVVPDGVFTPPDLIDSADKALYAAKHGGRNRVEFQECLLASELAKKKAEAAARPVPNRRRTDRRADDLGYGARADEQGKGEVRVTAKTG